MSAIVIVDSSVLLNIMDVPDRNQHKHDVLKEVRSALADEAPWKPINFPSNTEVLSWLDAFPDSATQGIGRAGSGSGPWTTTWLALIDRFVRGLYGQRQNSYRYPFPPKDPPQCATDACAW